MGAHPPALHPQVRDLWDALAARGIAAADPLAQPVAEARAAARRYHDALNVALPAVGPILDVAAPARDPAAPGRTVPVRIFHPPGRPGPLPVVVYFHGGGFVLNGVDTHDRLLRLLALRSGAAVAAVTYRLAPEHPFPAPLADALAAVAWLRAEGGGVGGGGLGLDAGRLALAGDSAGANLAMAAALALRDAGLPPARVGLSFYGMFSADLDTASHRAFGDGRFGLGTARMAWYWRQYLGENGRGDDPLAAPLAADLAGLPPQVVIAAGLDCLLDDSRRLTARLGAARVPVEYAVYDGLPHSFAQLTAFVQPADQAVTAAAHALARHLGPPPSP